MFTGVLRTIRDGLISLAYPSNCRVCGGAIESWDDGIACDACWSDHAGASFPKDPYCLKCGLPLGRRTASVPPASTGNCLACDGLAFASARACGAYDGALEASVLFLKTQPHICKRLSRMIFETFDRHAEALWSDIVIPVPLHPMRLRERGFNQARLIASKLARGSDLQLDDKSLVRTRYTERHRAGLDAIDRAKSVSDAFAVNKDAVKGRSVLVVDDLFTTGSTVNAAATILLEAGATTVNVFTLARTVRRPV